MKRVLCFALTATFLLATVCSANAGTPKKIGRGYKGVTCSHAQKSKDAGSATKSSYRKGKAISGGHNRSAHNGQKKWSKPISTSRNPMKGIKVKKSYARIGNKPTWMTVNRRG